MKAHRGEKGHSKGETAPEEWKTSEATELVKAAASRRKRGKRRERLQDHTHHDVGPFDIPNGDAGRRCERSRRNKREGKKKYNG